MKKNKRDAEAERDHSEVLAFLLNAWLNPMVLYKPAKETTYLNIKK